MRLVFSLLVLALATAGTMFSVPGNPRAQSACKLYKVNVPILQVRKDPRTPGAYVTALASGETACVSDAPLVGPNGYVVHKTIAGGTPVLVGGWANLAFMTSLDAGGAPASTTAGIAAAVAAPQPPAEADGDATLQAAQAVLRFNQPIPYGASNVRGKSIKELAEGTPLFPPIEGLPDAMWQKPCATCHKWTQQALCDQGKSYILTAAQIFRHPHPYGGPYKLSLMRWAKDGCK